jgi:hypothetical protein
MMPQIKSVFAERCLRKLLYQTSHILEKHKGENKTHSQCAAAVDVPRPKVKRETMKDQ